MINKNISKILLFSFFTFVFANLQAQQGFYNEWINPTKTYYKFKIASDGLYRISDASLVSLGIPLTSKSQLQLWRNGKEIPLFEGNDYIEFWGEKNDGEADKPFFKYAEYHINPKYSFVTDVATYFLTLSNTNLRFSNQENNIAARGALLPEPYFMHNVHLNFDTHFSNGPGESYGPDYMFDSRYHYKTFGQKITSIHPLEINLPALHLYYNNLGTTPESELKLAILGQTELNGERNIQIKNKQTGATILSTPLVKREIKTISEKFVADNSFSSSISLHNIFSSTAEDNVLLSYFSYTYPRIFDFGGLKNFSFSLPATSQNRYIKIKNFDAGGSVPILYDLTNKKRYISAVNGADFEFLLTPTTQETKYVLVGQSTQSYTIISTNDIVKRNFIDFNNVANQADYLIVSNKVLYENGNYVQQYADYRKSAEGGEHNAKVYDIDVLEDMFAWGIKSHPLSIKNFVRYANAHFVKKPEYLFLIGRGLPLIENRKHQNKVQYQEQNLVPTYGNPPSDIMLGTEKLEPIPTLNIGRISVVHSNEIKIYLDKVKEYEKKQKLASSKVEDKLWMKNAIFATGGNSLWEENAFGNYSAVYQKAMTGEYYGANASVIAKTSSESVSGNTANQRMKALFAEGVSLLSYYGHGASTTIALSELNSPDPYEFNGKYPVILVSGCDVGDYYSFMTDRMTKLSNIPERFLFTKDKGAVVFVSQSYLGITSFLHRYNETFYPNLAKDKYGQPIFQSMIAANKSIINKENMLFGDSTSSYAHACQSNLLGDPAIKLNYSEKPDFAVISSSIQMPSQISYKEEKMQVKIYYYNIGKYLKDSVLLTVTHTLPDRQSVVLFDEKVAPLKNIDSLTLEIPIKYNLNLLGNNQISVEIDRENFIPELFKENNKISATINIFADGISPLFPYDYMIVEKNQQKLIAAVESSSLSEAVYEMQLDTVATFDSPYKIIKKIKSLPGAVEFDPQIIYENNKVYYWRVASVPKENEDYKWSNTSSFQFVKEKGEGLGQAHYNQFLNSTFEKMSVKADKNFEFGNKDLLLYVAHKANANYDAVSGSSYNVELDGVGIASGYCRNLPNSMVFNILSPNLVPLVNLSTPTLANATNALPTPGVGNGFMGSTSACGSTPYSYDMNPNSLRNRSTYQFTYATANDRNKIAQFIDWIPDNYYVFVRVTVDNYHGVPDMANTWKTDGANSMYQKLKDQGLTKLEELTSLQAGIFVFRKNNQSFVPIQHLSGGEFASMSIQEEIQGTETSGAMYSPLFGPAKKWKTMEWDGIAESTTTYTFEIYGTSNDGTETKLMTINSANKITDISSIDANIYKYLRLKLSTNDAIVRKPLQLKYWRLLYDALPEGILASNISVKMKDSIFKGEDFDFEIAFKNVANVPFTDSLITNITLKDKHNNIYNIASEKLKVLQAGDFALIKGIIPGNDGKTTSVTTSNLDEKFTLTINVNPNLLVPELSESNNMLIKTITVVKEDSKPMIDVTFNGTHILDNDIVAAKPTISIKLSDESKYFLLKDTSVINVKLKFPSEKIQQLYYTADGLKFIPASNVLKNEAEALYMPTLTEDGTYELIVTGKNPKINPDAIAEYSIRFQVYNKPMISDMFNYPNPFTTSTAFVFTLTGSEVPQDLRIQILTATGKIVKEISKQELGPIVVGRNITQYKWDGTDMYGQQLANGVYLYRVITSQNGKFLDNLKVKDASGNPINTSKYFNKGYGKMYLMR